MNHNPHGITNDQIPEGWRLLTVEELSVLATRAYGAQYWDCDNGEFRFNSSFRDRSGSNVGVATTSIVPNGWSATNQIHEPMQTNRMTADQYVDCYNPDQVPLDSVPDGWRIMSRTEATPIRLVDGAKYWYGAPRVPVFRFASEERNGIGTSQVGGSDTCIVPISWVDPRTVVTPNRMTQQQFDDSFNPSDLTLDQIEDGWTIVSRTVSEPGEWIHGAEWWDGDAWSDSEGTLGRGCYGDTVVTIRIRINPQTESVDDVPEPEPERHFNIVAEVQRIEPSFTMAEILSTFATCGEESQGRVDRLLARDRQSDYDSWERSARINSGRRSTRIVCAIQCALLAFAHPEITQVTPIATPTPPVAPATPPVGLREYHNPRNVTLDDMDGWTLCRVGEHIQGSRIDGAQYWNIDSRTWRYQYSSDRYTLFYPEETIRKPGSMGPPPDPNSPDPIVRLTIACRRKTTPDIKSAIFTNPASSIVYTLARIEISENGWYNTLEEQPKTHDEWVTWLNACTTEAPPPPVVEPPQPNDDGAPAFTVRVTWNNTCVLIHHQPSTTPFSSEVIVPNHIARRGADAVYDYINRERSLAPVSGETVLGSIEHNSTYRYNERDLEIPMFNPLEEWQRANGIVEETDEEESEDEHEDEDEDI
jgi:hypothetical protein